MFDFYLFSQMVKQIYPSSGCSWPINDVLFVFKYFFSEYEYRIGRPHPPISKSNAAKIMVKMPESEDGIGLSPDTYIDLIDQYFTTDFPDCDYRISHFFSGRIRDNRIYEVMHG